MIYIPELVLLVASSTIEVSTGVFVVFSKYCNKKSASEKKLYCYIVGSNIYILY